MALATDALEWRTQREQDIRDAYADKNRWTALDYVTDQHDYSFRSIEAWPLDAAVIYNPTDRAALLLGSLKAACSLEDIVETTSLKVTVVVTMCAQEMQITAPTDWTKYFEEQDVFHIQCHLEDTTLKPTRRWLEQIPDLVASCLRQWKIVCRAVATSEKTSVASLAQSTLCLGSVEGLRAERLERSAPRLVCVAGRPSRLFGTKLRHHRLDDGIRNCRKKGRDVDMCLLHLHDNRCTVGTQESHVLILMSCALRSHC